MVNLRVSRLSAEVLTQPDSELMVSRLSAEVLVKPDSELRVSRLSVEVLVATTTTQTLPGVLFDNPPTFLAGILDDGSQILSGALYDNPPTFNTGALNTGAGGDQDLDGTLFNRPPSFPALGVQFRGNIARHSLGNFPIFTGVNTNSGTGNVTLDLPDSFPAGGGPSITGDLFILLIGGEGENSSPQAAPTGDDWTFIATVASHEDSSPTSVRITMYYHWYDYDNPPNLVVPDTGDHTMAAVMSWRDVNPSNPLNVIHTEFVDTLETDHTIGAATTTEDLTMVLVASGRGGNVGALNITNSGFGSPISNAFTLSTTAGSDGSISTSYFVLSDAGSTGTNTYSTSPTAVETASMIVALNPLIIEGIIAGMPYDNPPLFYPGVITGGAGGGGGDGIGGWGFIPIGI